MEERKNVNLTDEMLRKYQDYLRDEERSLATIEKYVRDVRRFMEHLGDGELSRESVREYKQELKETYKITSANSMLAAVNSFLVFAGCGEWKVKLFKIQKVQYSRPEREITGKEYERLVHTARRQGDEQMSMLLQTVGSTGIRISELKYISVESLETGRAEIYNKGKSRVVLLPGKLVDMLRKYCRKKGIQSGSIFITRNGNPMDRSNISKRMKRLAVEAGVDTAKVFPHNLRHLFARVFYSMEKDVVRLMDLLGHSNISTTRIYTTRHQVGRMNLILG